MPPHRGTKHPAAWHEFGKRCLSNFGQAEHSAAPPALCMLQVSGEAIRAMAPGQAAEVNALRNAFGSDYEARLRQEAGQCELFLGWMSGIVLRLQCRCSAIMLITVSVAS